MTAREIQRRLISDIWRQSFAMPNYTPEGWWECDVFEVTKAGYFKEYEIKISRTDFKADALKKKRGQYWLTKPDLIKHEQLDKRSTKGPKQFTFIVPENLVKPDELPWWAGLTYASVRTGVKAPWHIVLQPVKPAPVLHREKLNPDITAHARGVCYYRFNNIFIKGKFDTCDG